MKKISRLFEFCTVFIILAIGVLTTAAAIARYLFTYVISGMEELSGWVLAFIIFMMLATCQMNKVHIRVDVLLGKINARFHKMVWKIVLSIEILTTAILASSASWYCWRQYNWGVSSLSGFPVKMYIPIMFMAIGLLLLLIQLILDLLSGYDKRNQIPS